MTRYDVPERTWLVRVRVEGIPTIADGRIFFFDSRELDDKWRPPMEMPRTSVEGVSSIEHVACPDMPTHCAHCGGIFEYEVLNHSFDWMTGIFACPDHPNEVWVDIYPKRNARDTRQDRFNAWAPHYARQAGLIPVDAEQVLRYRVIDHEIEDEIQNQLDRQRLEAPLLFTFTPDGLVPIPPAIKPHWLQRGLQWVADARIFPTVREQ